MALTFDIYRYAYLNTKCMMIRIKENIVLLAGHGDAPVHFHTHHQMFSTTPRSVFLLKAMQTRYIRNRNDNNSINGMHASPPIPTRE